jgi:hypothetical protein
MQNRTSAVRKVCSRDAVCFHMFENLLLLAPFMARHGGSCLTGVKAACQWAVSMLLIA